MNQQLSHLDAGGHAKMVDVGGKAETERTATARARVTMLRSTLDQILHGSARKGDVLAVARVAGIMAAKQTPALIPLCHPIPLASITLDLTPDEGASAVDIAATVTTVSRTGVEMEALTAASIAALTIYDMLKAVDRGMRIEAVHLTHKAGGKSGEFRAD